MPTVLLSPLTKLITTTEDLNSNPQASSPTARTYQYYGSRQAHSTSTRAADATGLTRPEQYPWPPPSSPNSQDGYFGAFSIAQDTRPLSQDKELPLTPLSPLSQPSLLPTTPPQPSTSLPPHTRTPSDTSSPKSYSPGPSSGVTTPVSSEGCNITHSLLSSFPTIVRVPQTSSSTSSVPCLGSPSAWSADLDALPSPTSLGSPTFSLPTPLASPPHRSIFHFASSDSLRPASAGPFRPPLLRTSSEAAAALMLARQSKTASTDGSSTSVDVLSTFAATAPPMKRSHSVPLQLSQRASLYEVDIRPAAPVLARRLSDVAIEDKFTPGRQARVRAEERRYRALLELVETEEAYLQDLEILSDVYFSALNFTPLHPSARAMIWRNIDEILSWHKSLHAAFQDVQQSVGWRISDLAASEAKWDDAKVLVAIEAVMHVFKQRAQGLQLYETFCAQHSDAASLLRQHESNKHAWDIYIEHCNTILETRFPHANVGPRLTLYDYLIKPVQRICRYPLMLSQLKSFLDMANPDEAAAALSVHQALNVVRGAAAAVDAAKMLLVSQRRTRNVASRMEMPPSTRPAFLGILGQVSLAGALFFTEIPAQADGTIRVKYFGCFLYESHLVIVKVKRQDSYEPRHWFPLRAFSIESLPEGEGLLPHSLRLRHGRRTFELAATCAQERDIWVEKLQETAANRKRAWLEAIFHNPVAQPYDDFVISSVAIEHDAIPGTPTKEDAADELPPNRIISARPNLSSSSLNSLSGRSRFSAVNILGKSTTNMRDAIDLRLAEVFSDALLVARISGEEEHMLHTRPSLLTGLRAKGNSSQQTAQLTRRGTTRGIQQRKTSILENSTPLLQRSSGSQTTLHQRRASTEAEGMATPIQPPLQRSKTNPAKPRSEAVQLVNRRSWTGSIRRRTSSWMGSQAPPPLATTSTSLPKNALELQVSVARNDSSSSSGSSRDMVRTPSPMSSAPPSPMVNSADSPQLRELPLASPAIPRRSSSGSTGTLNFGSAEQDMQALRATKYFYDTPDTNSKFGWMSSVRGKRGVASGLSLRNHTRSQSSGSLLTLFQPILSPMAPSPLTEEEPQQGGHQPLTLTQQPPSPVSPTSGTSSDTQLAMGGSPLSHPIALSPPPAKASLRRTKSKRFSSLFPLTRLNSSGSQSTGSLVTSP